MTQWYIRRHGIKTAAHIWTGTDTACRMASTGGLNRHRYHVTDDRGAHRICGRAAACQSISAILFQSEMFSCRVF